MSTPEPTPDEQPAPPGPGGTGPAPDPAEQRDEAPLPQWARDQIAKARKDAAGYREKLRAAEPLAKRAQDADEASKTETQRLTEQAQANLARAEKAERELLRTSVAARKGLTPDQARRLVGATEEELDADADELLAAFAGANGTATTPPPAATLPRRRPTERLRGGDDPDEPAEETDPRKLAAQIPRGF